MKITELRIGNLINRGDCICRVIGIEAVPDKQPSIFTDPIEKHGISLSETFTVFIANPIPLTEEWLVNFGFIEKNLGKKLPQSWYEVKYLSNEHEPMITSWVSILINKETWSCVICDEYPDEMGANTKTQIKYVHQLQNLYFALTGEELELKEVKP